MLINRAFEDGNLFTRVQGKALPAWAAEFGAQSWAQVFLKFVLAHPAVTCVIPATGKIRNLADNLAAGMGALPDAKQRAQIVAASRVVQVVGELWRWRARSIRLRQILHGADHPGAAGHHGRMGGAGRITDDAHAGGQRRRRAGRRILDDDAVGGARAEPLGRE